MKRSIRIKIIQIKSVRMKKNKQMKIIQTKSILFENSQKHPPEVFCKERCS